MSYFRPCVPSAPPFRTAGHACSPAAAQQQQPDLHFFSSSLNQFGRGRNDHTPTPEAFQMGRSSSMPNKAAAMSSPRGKGAASKKKASGERSSGYDHTRNDQRRGTRRVSSDKSGGGLCGGRCRVLGYTPRAPNSGQHCIFNPISRRLDRSNVVRILELFLRLDRKHRIYLQTNRLIDPKGPRPAHATEMCAAHSQSNDPSMHTQRAHTS